jgi:hypothetical protein
MVTFTFIGSVLLSILSSEKKTTKKSYGGTEKNMGDGINWGTKESVIL